MRLPWWITVGLLIAMAHARAQEVKPPPIPADQLVRQVVANETAPSHGPAIKHMFRSRKQTPKGSQTHLYVETTDAMAGMLIAINDHPLTAEQQQAETGHLQWLVDNPDQLHKKHARENADDERSTRMVKAFPDAFRYEYAGSEASTPDCGKMGDTLVRLNFKPNPDYSPPSHEEQVLTGMQGYLLIDAQAKRIARIDGRLFKDVTFGWGIFGRLDQGGQFLVQQADVGDGIWTITRMNLSFTGKILLVKSFNMISDEVFSDFRRVPDNTSFAQAVAMLKTEEAKTANTSTPASAAPQP
jgi:hypothetical protein